KTTSRLARGALCGSNKFERQRSVRPPAPLSTRAREPPRRIRESPQWRAQAQDRSLGDSQSCRLSPRRHEFLFSPLRREIYRRSVREIEELGKTTSPHVIIK